MIQLKESKYIKILQPAVQHSREKVAARQSPSLQTWSTTIPALLVSVSPHLYPFGQAVGPTYRTTPLAPVPFSEA